MPACVETCNGTDGAYFLQYAIVPISATIYASTPALAVISIKSGKSGISLFRGSVLSVK